MAAYYFLLTPHRSSTLHYLYPQQHSGRRLFRRPGRVKNAAASVGRLRRRVTHETFSPTVQPMLLRSQWVELRSGGGGGGAGRMGGERPIRLATKPWLPLRLEQNSLVVFSFWIFFSSDGKTKHSANSVAGTLMLFSKEEKTVLCKRCCRAKSRAQSSVFPHVKHTQFRLKGLSVNLTVCLNGAPTTLSYLHQSFIFYPSVGKPYLAELDLS